MIKLFLVLMFKNSLFEQIVSCEVDCLIASLSHHGWNDTSARMYVIVIAITILGKKMRYFVSK